MKALIERQLYRPAVVMPLLILMGLMVTLDFNLIQVTFVAVLKSSQYVLHVVFRRRGGDARRVGVNSIPEGTGHSIREGTCHC